MRSLLVTILRTIHTMFSTYQVCPMELVPEREPRLFVPLNTNGEPLAVRTTSVALPEPLRNLWLPVSEVNHDRDHLEIRFTEATRRDTGYVLPDRIVTSAVLDWVVAPELVPEFPEAPADPKYVWGHEALETDEQVRDAIQIECARYLSEEDLGTVTDPEGRRFLIAVTARLVPVTG